LLFCPSVAYPRSDAKDAVTLAPEESVRAGKEYSSACAGLGETGRMERARCVVLHS
jgi:hypothetical protein